MSDVDQRFTLVLFMLSERIRGQKPTFAFSHAMSGVAENPYQLIRLWWELPAMYRDHLEAGGMTPHAFQATVLALHREQTAMGMAGQVGSIVPLCESVCACAALSLESELEPQAGVVWLERVAERVG